MHIRVSAACHIAIFRPTLRYQGILPEGFRKPLTWWEDREEGSCFFPDSVHSWEKKIKIRGMRDRELTMCYFLLLLLIGLEHADTLHLSDSQLYGQIMHERTQCWACSGYTEVCKDLWSGVLGSSRPTGRDASAAWASFLTSCPMYFVLFLFFASISCCLVVCTACCVMKGYWSGGKEDPDMEIK